MRITQLRNATVLLDFNAPNPVRLLVDPMLAPRGALPTLKWLTTQRQRNPLVDLPDGTQTLLDGVTHALITHCQRGHFDHLDGAGKKFLRERQIPVLCTAHDAPYLAARGLLAQVIGDQPRALFQRAYQHHRMRPRHGLDCQIYGAWRGLLHRRSG
ncbi:hypothetical protein LP414_18310 [Polaromonas sp. P1(28)-13]|nr:hypothetical protein LP414_18310 [Polaromonas sp. P1(28)-13]